MPVALSYPGVYIQEVSSGVRTITGVATSITAFIGRTAWGPVNEPVTINNFGDFERQFGGLGINYPLSYAVRDFYLNGGSQAIITRLFITTESDLASLTVGGLKLEAKSPGTWGAELTATTVTVDADSFNLTVQLGTKRTETFLNLTVKDTARRIDRVLKAQSNLVRWKGKWPDPAPATATEASDVHATGGVDSAALNQAAYEGTQADKTGLYALDKADIFNLLCIPPDTREGDTLPAVYQKAMKYCQERRAMLIVDSPAEWSANSDTAAAKAKAGLSALGLSGEAARNAALYFPRVIEADALRAGQLDAFVPCGIIAGIMAHTDTTRGVWKAPAGLDAAINGIHGLDAPLSDAENGMLNPLGINCLRSFPINGRVVWGSRTLRGADQLADEWKYIPVRRTALFIEESLYRGTQWIVFEPNDEPLWAQIRLNIGSFMHSLFRQGAFQGSSPKEAYFVKCDKETTTQDDINRGIVNIHVGFAPLKPAEFVVISIQQMAGQIQV